MWLQISYILSYLILSYLILSYLILSYLILSYLILLPSDTVFVYNSIDENISNSFIHDICSILFCQFQTLNIISKPVQIQKVTSDCGLFAIANAYCITSGGDRSDMNLDQSRMRDHLISCIENVMHKIISNFRCPINENSIKVK